MWVVWMKSSSYPEARIVAAGTVLLVAAGAAFGAAFSVMDGAGPTIGIGAVTFTASLMTVGMMYPAGNPTGLNKPGR